jgi:lipid-binding SYLF domain-containing protein
MSQSCKNLYVTLFFDLRQPFRSNFPTVQSFVDNSNNGLDGVIPREVLENAKGFAIFTIVKAGFVFSARAGSGIVIAKLDNGCESFAKNLLTFRPKSSFSQHGLHPAQSALQASDLVVRQEPK